MKKFVLEMTGLIGGNLLTQCFAAFEPAGDRFKAFPAAVTVAFQVNSAAEWRTGVTVGKYSLSTLGAFKLEEFGMVDCGLDERTQPHRVWSQF